ncbi:hypothetical protein FNV43_RR15290 [Rhamnella rubrinervis]|uniref:Disease resistance RPP13-like protein 1 n=1 Tax=Rhamnella rubrinervis TaxID=2594499 RepID=A0A8K0E729_9ROSA|nr:hypothetical protein FNV43_RR15290 [Rhamnella rubrinervis]
MALEVVGGALLSASLEVLFPHIDSIVDFVRRKKVNEELLRQLRNKLLLANGVLDDAERQQITKPDVREWLELLKDAIQKAEDLVDDIKIEADRQRGSRVCKFFSSRFAVKDVGRRIQNIIKSVDDIVEDMNRLGLREGVRQMGSRVRKFFSSRFSVKDVERRIQNIIKSVDDIVEDMNRLGLREGVKTSIPFHIQRSCLNILAKKSDVLGRDAEKETIFKFLNSDSGHKFSVMPIVGMGGIGKTTLAQLVYTDVIDGALVLEKPFDINTWITVADESKSDAFTLTKAIYEAVNGPLDNTIKETFQVQLKLKKALQGKKFLFILDDVWNVDYQTWNDLQTPFESAANGSKIIVTTRLPNIAKDLATVDSEVLYLESLAEADCWLLFSKHAFNNVEPSSYPHLVKIGKKIVEKCGGNPLAVRSLACLLHSQLDPKKWENVLVNDIWELDQGQGGILPALWLSYYYLPRRLKRCFAYCSIIPKDYSFGKERLIVLWMAEGLLQPTNNMMLEEVGEEYFEDLTSRSFFLEDDGGRRFPMHDLVNDLAKFVSGESCLRLDGNCSENLTRKTRHISCMLYHQTPHYLNAKLEDLSENKLLRTLLVLDNWKQLATQHVINPEQLGSMKYLRVLSASQLFFYFGGYVKLFKSIGRLKNLRYLNMSCDGRIKEIPDSICKLCNLQTLLLMSCSSLHTLPESIGNLKHLRYLNLSCTPIEKIPDTLCNLYELRTLNLSSTRIEKIPDALTELHELRALDLSGTGIEKIPDSLGNLHKLRTLSLAHCENLTQLPTSITMLTNLCNLDIGMSGLREMPPKISNLKNLRSLPEFVVGKSGGLRIEELGKLTNLHGGLCIRSLENVEEVEDVSEANLKNKNNITKLILGWTVGIDVSHNKAREVLDRLQPHTNIEKLDVENYGGSSFPDWIGHHSFSSIKKLVLDGCKNCSRLPRLGELPSLEVLWIQGFDMVERIDNEFYLNDSSSSSPSCVTEPPFKSLKELRFENMGEWKEWSLVDGAFPNLKELQLIGCPKLKGEGFPDYLPSMEELLIGDNHHVVASLPRCQYPSLSLLRIINCHGMKSFPQGRFPQGTIHTITIWGCNDLASLSEEGWPCSSLKSLEIIDCNKLFAHNNNWNLGMLTSLTSLTISYMNMEGMDSFPKEEGQLPTTLTSLKLEGLINLKSLNGTALRHLTSLQTLSISKCELQCLPEERLPTSLSELDISRCSLLKPRCKRGKGQDWDKIHHISNIKIDGNRI